MMKYRVLSACSMLCLACVSLVSAEPAYDFRKSDAYGRLSSGNKEKLEQVHRDFMMLWGAIDRYADGHDGNLPEALTQLVPHFLGDLPTDPFATTETAKQNCTKPYCKASKDGWGYC